MPITKINSLGITNPVAFSAGTVSLPSITFSGDTNTGVFAPAADTIGFAEGGAEAMRIDSDGDVGINTTSVPTKLCVKKTDGGALSVTNPTILAVAESLSDGVGSSIGFGTGDWQFSAIIGFSDGGGTFGGGLKFFTAADNSAWTERLRITNTGSLILAGSTAQKASGTTWSNPSDTRLKDNKQNYTKGLNELLQINVKTWEWNGKAGTTQGDVGIGVIADEIETILPNTIDTYKAKLNENDTEETDVKRFDATEITWLLLNSVKEQQVIIEQLKAISTSQQTKIDALEARLTALESK